jgi:hypothetical protein
LPVPYFSYLLSVFLLLFSQPVLSVIYPDIISFISGSGFSKSLPVYFEISTTQFAINVALCPAEDVNQLFLVGAR